MRVSFVDFMLCEVRFSEFREKVVVSVFEVEVDVVGCFGIDGDVGVFIGEIDEIFCEDLW